MGWELGGERGHAALLSPVITALRQRGHEVAVALKDPAALAGAPGLSGVPLLQAPLWPPPVPGLPGPSSQTVGDDLVSIGIERAVELAPRARAWADLIGQTRADVVLAETAPTLLLAARKLCPGVAFGTAYSLPPAGTPLPPALDVRRPPSPSSLAHEESLRQAFDGVDRQLGGPGLSFFSDLYAVPTWVCNLPELDPYGELRPMPAPGPLVIRGGGTGVPPERAGRPLHEHVFAYVKPMPVLPALVEALARRCRHLEVFISNAPAQVDNPWPNLTLHRSPIDLSRRLPEFSAVVHFGGLNLSAEALFAGVPQLILPTHLEQSATAMAVARLGLGHARVNVPREPERESERQALVAQLVEEFFADTGLGARAAEYGQSLRARQQPSLEGLVTLCEQTARV